MEGYNIMVHNFPESTDRNNDIESFKDLIDTVQIRIGYSLGSSTRTKSPLLSVENVDNKAYMVFHSHFLKRHEQYCKVYIAPDRTELEHV